MPEVVGMIQDVFQRPLSERQAMVEAQRFAEGEPVRIYLAGEFWGIAVRREEELVWKAQIAPEG